MRPFLGHSLKKISNVVSACLIMHNMCASDRVMGGDVNYARYNPANSLTIDEDEMIENENGEEIGAAASEGGHQQILWWAHVNE